MDTRRREESIILIVAISFLSCLVAGNYDEQYIGCYKEDGSNPELGDGIEEASMTISSCLTHCSSNGKTFAATQNGKLCFCGESYGKYGPSKECNINCRGDNIYYCGGNLANSIYAVCPIGRYGSSCDKECHCANEAPCFLINGTCSNNICASGWSGIHCDQTSVTVASLSYHGCFTDARTNGFPIISDNPAEMMTIPLCMDRCKTRFGLYAGLQYAYACACGNSSYSNNGTSDHCGNNCGPSNGDCSCTGSPSDRCGGPYANDVYSVCQFGYYGVLCGQRCHCHEPTLNCTMENGTCSNKGCSPGWTGTACNIRNCADSNGECTGIHEVCIEERIGNDRFVPRCRCSQGYNRTMEYETCADINECSLGLPDNQCDPTTGLCSNLPGTYNCTCKEGYENDGMKACKDVDECLLMNNECDNETSTCQDTQGSYSCQCLPGYKPGTSPRQCSYAGTSDVIVGAIVGTLCAILLILAIIAGIYFYRRKTGFCNKKGGASDAVHNISKTEEETHYASLDQSNSKEGEYEELKTNKTEVNFQIEQKGSDSNPNYASLNHSDQSQRVYEELHQDITESTTDKIQNNSDMKIYYNVDAMDFGDGHLSSE